MKNKSIVFALIICGAGLAVLAGVYFIQKNKALINPSEQDGPTTTKTQNKIVTDSFSINLPDGWTQTTAPTGATAMAVNSNDNITDPEAKKINFQSYFAVVYGALSGKSMKEYIQLVKDSLPQKFGSVVFVKEQDLTINGQQAHQIEIEINQQGVNFKVLLVLIKGQADDAWMLSFNTTKSNWEDYQEIFYTTADSFIVKK
ncbi:MAG: hypothetical protein WC306_02270 [Candidatus Paceibacterota bacterium]|jgi:hypothetical protein